MSYRDPISYSLYRMTTRLASPILAAWLWAHSRHRPLLERFHPRMPTLHSPPLWVHACSAGEVGAAKPLLQGLHERWPALPIVLTVSTASGYAMAADLADSWLQVTYLPFDTRRAVCRFLDALSPRGLLLMETELWPSVIYETRRRAVPVLLISGRLSAKHVHRYRRASWLFRPLLRQLTAVGAQTPLYAERFESLGVPPERVHVTGNAKYDGVRFEVSDTDGLRERIGLVSDEPVFVFGSTRPGDEVLAVSCWLQLRDRFPALRLIVAPRHLQRMEEVLGAIGQPVSRWSEMPGNENRFAHPVLVVDTMGDLIRFYALATVAVVGGSFYPGVEGHNPFEPAALGVPTVFGPYMANFAEPASMLLGAGGAVQVRDPAELPEMLADLLVDAARRGAVGAAGRAVAMESRGAIARTLELVEAHLVL